MSSPHRRPPLSLADHLESEEVSPVKHEFVDGTVYAMSEACVNHSHIATNAVEAFYVQLCGHRCQAFNSDRMLRIRQSRSTRFDYPDLSVVCRPNVGTDSYHDDMPSRRKRQAMQSNTAARMA